MELRRHNIIAFNRRDKGRAVSTACCDNIRFVGQGVIGMHEVNHCAVFHAREKFGLAREIKRAPTHVRNLQARRFIELNDFARHYTQTGVQTEFFAPIEQQLQREADAEKRLATFDDGKNRFVQAIFFERLYRRAERADAGHDELFGARHFVGIARNFGLVAQMCEGFFDASQIVDAAVDDGDHVP